MAYLEFQNHILRSVRLGPTLKEITPILWLLQFVKSRALLAGFRSYRGIALGAINEFEVN